MEKKMSNPPKNELFKIISTNPITARIAGKLFAITLKSKFCPFLPFNYFTPKKELAFNTNQRIKPNAMSKMIINNTSSKGFFGLDKSIFPLIHNHKSMRAGGL